MASKGFNQEMGNYLSSRKHHIGRFHGVPHGKNLDAKKSFEDNRIEVIEGEKTINISEIFRKLFGMSKKQEEAVKLAEEEIEVNEVQQKLEPTECEEEELEKLPRNPGFFSRLLNIFKKEDVDKEFIDEYEDERDTLDEDVSEIKDDLRQVAKITTNIMSRISNKELEKFKSSEDFAKFKDILKKYEMIK